MDHHCFKRIALVSLLASVGCDSPRMMFSDVVNDAITPRTDAAEDATVTTDDGTLPEDSGTSMDDTGVETDVVVQPNAVVYAHSSSELHRVDPTTFTVQRVGAFTFPDDGFDHRMTDIAVTATGALWGVTFEALYRIDARTAQCTLVRSLAPAVTVNALSFVPGPNGEQLVGATESGILYEINTVTGVTRQIGRYANNDGSSGDIVSIEDAGTFATITRGANNEEWVARVETNGTSTPLFRTNRTGTWGLGFWGGTLYGFTTSGEFITIDLQTQSVTQRAQSGVTWWGAGVTTRAPVTTSHM